MLTMASTGVARQADAGGSQFFLMHDDFLTHPMDIARRRDVFRTEMSEWVQCARKEVRAVTAIKMHNAMTKGINKFERLVCTLQSNVFCLLLFERRTDFVVEGGGNKVMVFLKAPPLPEAVLIELEESEVVVPEVLESELGMFTSPNNGFATSIPYSF